MSRRAARRAAARAAGTAAPRTGPAAFGLPGILVLASACALVAFAPADSNLVWAVNGLHRVAAAPLLLLLCASFAALLWAAGLRVPGALVAALASLALAWPLREAGHLLGDTYVRWRTLDRAAAGGLVPDFAGLARQMHAQPLDDLFGLWGPIQLVRAGVPAGTAIAGLGAALALTWFWTASRIARRLAPAGAPAAFAAALAIAGSLEVFAAYAESGGVVLVFAALWWLALMRPLARPRDAALAALAWLAFAMAHRVALVALLPQLARATAVRFEGDAPLSRRALLAGTLAAAAVAAVVAARGAEGALARDWGELVRTFGHFTPPADVLNLLLVVSPLALLAPVFAGARRLGELARTPLGALHAIAFVPLAPLLLVYPVAAHGLGAHRDWELALVPGLVATSFAGAALARLDEARLRGALMAVLPALVLLAGAWVLPNADDGAVQRRAETLVTRPHGAAGEARGHALVYLGYRASDRRDNAASARWFDASFETLPNRRTALLAAESWLRAGELAAARASIGRARSQGALPDELERGARILEGMLARADSAAAGAGAAR